MFTNLVSAPTVVAVPEVILDDFADALIGASEEGEIRVWAGGAARMYGWSEAEAIGRRFVELVVPIEHRVTELARLRSAVAGPITYESVRSCKDGTSLHVDVSVRAVLAHDGSVRRIAISEKDVSLLKYRRDAAALEARFRGLLDAAPDAIVLVNEAGRIVMVNVEAQRLFGYEPEQLIGSLIETLVPDRYRAGHPARRASYATDPRTRPMGAGLELWARRRDGSEFPAEISLSRMQLAEGTFTTTAIRDVTQRRRVEGKFRGLLEAAPDAIVIVDTEGRIVLVNAQAERMFGYSRNELIGQSVDMLVPRRARDRHVSHRAHFAADSRPRAMGSELELQAVRKDGTEFPVEISLSPLETEDGTLFSSAIRDVTRRQQTEHALKAAYAEVEAFSYSIAHDLRAPLRGMNGFAQILLEDYADRLDDDGREALNEISSNAIRMGALIEAMLSLARLSRAALDPAEVDLAAYARDAFAHARAEDPTRACELVTPEHMLAWADPPLARTLLENLVGNAWKFTAKSPSPRIEVGLAVLKGARTFFVRDNGAGFDMAHATKLFAPFQRLHRAVEYPGTGIGLATANRIVQRHGGRIWAESSLGSGATFYFTLSGQNVGVA